MLRAATVQDISKRRVTKAHGGIYVVTRYYPRFLKSQMIDEYYGVLAPKVELLKEFKDAEEKLGDHDQAFEQIDYESKFTLAPEALPLLGELAQASMDKHVFLVCHCDLKQYCHRELLFLIAEANFGAKIPKLSHSYDIFRKRLDEFKL